MPKKYKKEIRKNKKSERESIYIIFLRYTIIALFGLGNLYVFYLIFTPLTIYPVYFILSLFYKAILNNISLVIYNLSSLFQIDLVEACIAGAAYYLLLILNLSTNIKLKTRIYALLFSFILFLILNIIRIVFLTFLLINNFTYFDLTHKVLWYGLSTIFVVLIWFLTVWIFKIKTIPVYSDVRNIYDIIKKKK